MERILLWVGIWEEMDVGEGKFRGRLCGMQVLHPKGKRRGFSPAG
jgi:hypothetical protein